MIILITGGAGFIGSALVRKIIATTDHVVVNIDKLTYSGNLLSLASVADSDRYRFECCDIADEKAIVEIFGKYKPAAVIHLAAESHVDRSILENKVFVQSNIVGTYTLLECARNYWLKLDQHSKGNFRFLHISTDEVFGSLGDAGFFTESSSYEPNSPYSASKAAADHLARAWFKTYDFPTIISNCSNNFGPYQHPEKLIPLVINNAIAGKELPVYGNGGQIRDWLYVEDHIEALWQILQHSPPGETYNIGGNNEYKNIDVVNMTCDILDKIYPAKNLGIRSHKELITFVTDRPGHDQRYAIDASKIKKSLLWQPQYDFPTGLEKTVKWYLENRYWCQQVMLSKGAYVDLKLNKLC